jgi:hypothetical protein
VTVAGVAGAVTADEGGRLTIDVPLDAPLLPGEPVAMSVTID